MRTSLYADDAIVFINPVQADLRCVLDLLEEFGLASGLRINIGKRTVAPIHCDDIDLENVLLPFAGTREAFLLRYLGLPLSLGRVKAAQLQHIIDRARSRLAGWHGRWINAGGRRTLLNSVLDALPTFDMMALQLPKNFLASFDKIRRRFLWGIDEKAAAGGKCKISWAKVYSPLDIGGLGLANLGIFGRALRLRWFWFEWRAPDRLWVGTPTPCDKTYRDLFAAATRVAIGDGLTATFWHSNWLGGRPLRLAFPCLFARSRRKTRSVAEAVTDHRWVRDLHLDVYVPFMHEFLQAWHAIADISLQPNVPNSIRWILTADGSYSARSAYNLQFGGRSLSSMPQVVWRIWAPPKYKFFAWLMLQNRLWCADRLQRRGWPNCYFCPLCRRNLETALHLFIECPFSSRLWCIVALWPNCRGFATAIHEATSVMSFHDSLLSASPAEHRKGVCSLFILVSHSIWHERNSRVFHDKPLAINQLSCFIKDESQAWAFAGAKALRKLLWEQP